MPDNGYATPAYVDGEHKRISVENTNSNRHSSATFQSLELTTSVNDFGTKRIKKMGEQYSNSLNDFDVFRNKRRKLGTKTDSKTWNEKHKPHQISHPAHTLAPPSCKHNDREPNSGFNFQPYNVYI